MLAYISPSTTNSTQPSPTLPPRDPAITILSPTPTTSSPRFLAVNQAPHPSPPPSSAIASAFPRSKTMGRVPRLSLAPGSLGSSKDISGIRRRSKDRGSGSKRFEDVTDALREFEAILMGDEEESESEEEDMGDDGGGGGEEEGTHSDSDDAFISSGSAMDFKPTFKQQPSNHSSSTDNITNLTNNLTNNNNNNNNNTSIITTTVSPVSHRRPSWSTGAAREFSRFQLIVDIPVWSQNCGADYSTLLQLRDTTLQALHVIIDNLRLRGVSTTHRICLTNIQDRNDTNSSTTTTTTTTAAASAAYGCIRVAPPFNVPLSKLGPSFNMSGGRSLITDRMMGPLHMRRTTMGPGMVTSAGERAHEVGKIIRDALEKDRVERGRLFVEEGQSFIVGLYGQPALILT